MKSILHKSFVYTNSANTDIAKTIKREQARLRKIAADKALAKQTVVDIKARQK